MLPHEMKELGVVRQARACETQWSKMRGDDQVRFCARCGNNAYQLSGLDADDARALIRKNEHQRLCVRFWRRRDGTFMTADCARLELARWPSVAVTSIVLGLLLIAVVGVVTLFYDHQPRLFGMSADALAGDDDLVRRPAPSLHPRAP
jgi:hypothetical protein